MELSLDECTKVRSAIQNGSLDQLQDIKGTEIYAWSQSGDPLEITKSPTVLALAAFYKQEELFLRMIPEINDAQKTQDV